MAPLRFTLLIAIVGLSLACRNEPAPANPEARASATPRTLGANEARIEFLDVPPGTVVACVSGCEGMSVDPGEPGERTVTMVIGPIARPTPVRIQLVAPGYPSRQMTLEVEPGDNRVAVHMYTPTDPSDQGSEPGAGD